MANLRIILITAAVLSALVKVGECSAAAAASALCQPGWVLSYKDTCLKLSELTATWHAAKSRCQSLGGDLVTLEGLQKDLFIKGWLQSEGVAMVDNGPTYAHKGCFRDWSDRVLRGFNVVTVFCDLEFCANTCFKKGYRYMGVENGEHCLCGNETNYARHGLCSDVGCQCNKACLRDSSQICGDVWAINIYDIRQEQGIWVGGHEPINGIWRWDGLHQGYLTRDGWESGEPSNGNGEHCMALTKSRMLWSDKICGTNLKYICEKRAL